MGDSQQEPVLREREVSVIKLYLSRLVCGLAGGISSSQSVESLRSSRTEPEDFHMFRTRIITFVALLACLCGRLEAADFLYVSMSNQTIVRYNLGLSSGSAIEASMEFFTSSSRAMGIGFDSFGNLYVANRNSWDTTQVHATISKYDPDGNSLGPLANNFLDYPNGLAIDKDNYVYAASQQYGWIPVYKPDGTFDRLLDGPTTLYGIAVDSNKNLYATNPNAGAVIKFDSQGNLINTPGTPFGGYDFGNSGRYAIINPFFIAVDSDDNVYATSQVDRTIDARQTVKKFSSDGSYLLTFDTDYLTNGVGGLVVDRQGNLFVASGRNIVKFNSSGNFVLSWSTGNLDPYYLAVPVPEPSTYILCTLCVFCFVGIERYQRNRRAQVKLSLVNHEIG